MRTAARLAVLAVLQAAASTVPAPVSQFVNGTGTHAPLSEFVLAFDFDNIGTTIGFEPWVDLGKLNQSTRISGEPLRAEWQPERRSSRIEFPAICSMKQIKV